MCLRLLKNNSQWECGTHSGGKPEGGVVAHVGGAFSAVHTCGNFVLRQHFNMSTEAPPTAWTPAMKEKWVGLWQEHFPSQFSRVFFGDGPASLVFLLAKDLVAV